MSPKKPKRKRGGRGRRPVFTDLQKKQIRKIAQEEIDTAFRRMLGGIGIHRGRRKP